MINKPTLPPISGYVEVEIGGVRKYKNIVTGILMEDEVLIEEPDTREFILGLMEGYDDGE